MMMIIVYNLKCRVIDAEILGIRIEVSIILVTVIYKMTCVFIDLEKMIYIGINCLVG